MYSDLLLPCLQYLNTLQAKSRYVTYEEILVFSEFVLLSNNLSACKLPAVYQQLQLAGNIECTVQLEITNLIFLLWRCDPTRVMASSFLRFSRSHTTTQHSR